MNGFFTYLVESSICLIGFYLLYKALFENQKLFNLNRVYLSGSLALSLILPVLNIPVYNSEASGSYLVVMQSVVINGMKQLDHSSPGLDSVLYWIYAAGALLTTVLLLTNIGRLLVLVHSNRYRKERLSSCTLIHTNGDTPIGTFGRYIFWDNQNVTNSRDHETILEHEKVHVHQNHTLDILFIELVGILFWFNPVVYFLKRSIRENHEFIADHLVSENNTQEYIRIMARKTIQDYGFALASQFKRSQIVKRIYMLNLKQNRSAGTRYLLITPLLATLVVVFSCETSNPELLDSEQAIQESLSTEQMIEGDIFQVVEIMPQFEGGNDALVQYLSENITYPAEAKEDGVEGRVIVHFVVSKEGEVGNVKVASGIGSGCDAEAVRVIRNSPKWTPGSQRGRNVNVKMVLPINFKL